MQLTANETLWDQIPPKYKNVLAYGHTIVENYLFDQNIQAKVEINYKTSKIFIDFKNSNHAILFRLLYSEHIE